MATVILNMLLWSVSSVVNVISVAAVKTGAVLLVMMVKILRLPWATLMAAPSLAATAIRAVADWLVTRLVKLTLTLIENLVKLAPKVVSGCVSFLSFNVTAVMEETRHRIEDIMELAPEVYNGIAETMESIQESFIDSVKHATKYVMKKVD